MKKLITLLVVFALLVGGGYYFYSMKQANTIPATTKSMELRTAMRKLWEDHITYTRNYIISALANLEDAQSVVERLMQNQTDIGNAIKPVYGEEAGNKLTALLKDHIAIAAEVVGAAKSGDKKALKASSDKWNANADEIALFLSAANLNWDKAVLKDMLYKHLEFTTGEVSSRLGKKWKEDIAFYDNGHDHMLMFADVLTDGITQQFPDKF